MLAGLYRDYAVSLLPAATDVEFLHALIVEECSKPDPLFVVRQVQGTERGRVYTTAQRCQFIPSDNRPPGGGTTRRSPASVPRTLQTCPPALDTSERPTKTC